MENIENKSIYEVLKERDLIKQIAFEDEFIELSKSKKNFCIFRNRSYC